MQPATVLLFWTVPRYTVLNDNVYLRSALFELLAEKGGVVAPFGRVASLKSQCMSPVTGDFNRGTLNVSLHLL